MVARILGKLLHMVGVLPTHKVTEVQRTDLVGEFVGHTGPKTRRKVFLPSLLSEMFSIAWFSLRETVKQILNLIFLRCYIIPNSSFP